MLLEWVIYYSMVTLTKGSKAMARPVQKLADFASSLIILTLILEAAGVSVGDAVADLGNQVLGRTGVDSDDITSVPLCLHFVPPGFVSDVLEHDLFDECHNRLQTSMSRDVFIAGST